MNGRATVESTFSQRVCGKTNRSDIVSDGLNHLNKRN